MVILFDKTIDDSRVTEIIAWVKKNYHPMSEIEGYEPKSTADDLSNVIFQLDGKFYGPVHQHRMPKHLWVPLSRAMVELKNSKKVTTVKTEINSLSDYQSRCCLITPGFYATILDKGWNNRCL